MDETELTVDTELDDTTSPDTERTGEESSDTDGLKERALNLLKPTLVMTIVFTAAAFIVGTFIPIIPGAGLLGVGLAGLVAGLTGRGSYASAALAGGTAGLLSMALNFVVLSLFGGGAGLPVLALVGFLGIVAGVGGYHFGKDFYDGITDPV